MPFVPRLNKNGMFNDPVWYSDNPFYNTAGHEWGLPNCTCYAWGRAWETNGGDPLYRPTFSTGDAGQWYGYTADGYSRGSTPQLGSVICFSHSGGGMGHVAVVEEINGSQILTSNSAYHGSYSVPPEIIDKSDPSIVNYTDYFYLQTLNPPYSFGQYVFQGFIYYPAGGSTPAGQGKFKPWMAKRIMDIKRGYY